MTTEHVDVLIVGAGPTGTALAIDLLRRGHSVRILDRSAASFEGSRAKGVQPRSLEVLEDLGALDDVLAGGSNYPLLGLHVGPITAPWPMIKTRPPRPGVPYPSTWLIPQFRTNAALHARLNALGGNLEFGAALVGLSQADDKVTATVRGGGGSGPDEDRSPEQVTAKYLVGADGGASSVRKAVGIAFEGSTDESDRIILFDAETEGLSKKRWHVWPGIGGSFVGACPLPGGDSFQWMIRIGAEDAPDLSDEAIRERVAERLGRGSVTLNRFSWKSLWRPNIRLAQHYRAERVLIAGDAAHVHTPAGAQGLNTGVQDAYNLGWKLSQVLDGAADTVLDTYEAERRPIAAAVLGLSTKKYEGLARLDPRSITRGPDEQQLTLTYRGGPLAPDGSATTSTLHVGDRAPDARLWTLDGRRRRLFEVFTGPHFTLIAFGAAAAAELDDVPWPTAGARLLRVAVSDKGSTGFAAPDLDLLDSSGEFATLYGTTSDTLLLVRPDGYLGAIARHDRPAAIARAASAFAPGLSMVTALRRSR